VADREHLRQIQEWLASTSEDLPFRMAQYWEDGWTHGHNYFASADENIESVAEGLAYAIHDCNENRHNGHGRKHSEASANAAYFDAISQLLGDEDIKAYRELRKNMRHYLKWGGHAPDVVFTPNQADPKKWDAIVKNPETGSASIYPTIQDIDMPSPDEIDVVPNRLGPGFVTR